MRLEPHHETGPLEGDASPQAEARMATGPRGEKWESRRYPWCWTRAERLKFELTRCSLLRRLRCPWPSSFFFSLLARGEGSRVRIAHEAKRYMSEIDGSLFVFSPVRCLRVKNRSGKKPKAIYLFIHLILSFLL